MEKMEQKSSNSTENEGNEVGKELPPGQEETQTSLTGIVRESSPWMDPAGCWEYFGKGKRKPRNKGKCQRFFPWVF